ncbi:MAG: YggN family protein [Colwellia sp.]|nr:YggN family protein [Colwellia sp.]MCW8864360.1 YggN family protein [Colwellia sp.]MCW9081079.1 YggN family protein [Colwellia sp.]
MKAKQTPNTFKKSLLAVTLLATLSSASVMAHNSCDVELEAGVNISKNSIEFFNEKNKDILYRIDNDESLFVAGQAVDLNDEQQALVSQYSASIKAMVPEVRTVAIEGVDLAVEGVNLAFNELLGEGNDVSADLTRELTNLRDEVSTRFTLEHGFTIGEDGLKNNDLLGDDFEQRIESAVEKAVMSSMGSIMVAVGQEMIFSGGDSDAFETRMENFGESIEHEMESRAEKIEHKAEQLCLSAVKIDQLEEQLQNNIESLADINVISARYNERASHKDDKSAM